MKKFLKWALAALTLCSGATLLPAQVGRIGGMTRGTSTTGINDSAKMETLDSAARTRAATVATFRKALSVHAFDSLSAGVFSMGTANVSGTPTWLSTQTFPSIVVGPNGHLTVTSDTVFGAPVWGSAQTFPGLTSAPGVANATSLTVTGGGLTGSDTHSTVNISDTWNTTGTSVVGFKYAVTNTAAGAGSLLFQVLGGAAGTASRMKLDTSGIFTTASTIVSGANILATSAGSIGFSSRSVMESASDGLVTLYNNGLTGFTRLSFGGTSSSFPALVTTTTTIRAMLADTSAYVQMYAKGTATNDTAVTLNVGEYLHHETGITTSFAFSTATAKNVDSLTLTAGDWMVGGTVGFRDTSATTVSFRLGTDSVSATFQLLQRNLFHPFAITGIVDTVSLNVPMVRYSLSSTTKVYLIGMATFSTNKVYGFGSIWARRVR